MSKNEVPKRHSVHKLHIDDTYKQYSRFCSLKILLYLEDIKLDPEKTSTYIKGCEFDYSSNTYRLQVTVNCGSVTVGENFVIVKVDGATGFPKILSVR